MYQLFPSLDSLSFTSLSANLPLILYLTLSTFLVPTFSLPNLTHSLPISFPTFSPSQPFPFFHCYPSPFPLFSSSQFPSIFPLFSFPFSFPFSLPFSFPFFLPVFTPFPSLLLLLGLGGGEFYTLLYY